ncbi:hypothetical protein KY347_04320 [Candidatus Woesearchaeota archaeon]|nr:hypothetical protein [Candidatus Woesearchaeota archaeon]
MNENLLKFILERGEDFEPLIFTGKQLKVMKKRLEGIRLSNSERKALYTSIKKKMEALSIIMRGEGRKLYITGHEHIIEERLLEAEKLVKEYSRKHDRVFIAGSFLFSKHYNDIDIFIIKEKGYKEKWEGKHHIVFISEKRLKNPIFQSAAKISISAFPIPSKLLKRRPKLSEAMSTYHEAVIELSNKDKKREMIRHLIFDYYLFSKSELLNPKKLRELVKTASLELLNTYIKELCIALFSKSYLYAGIHWYIQTLEEDIKSTKHNKNLIQYKKTYEELLYGRQRGKEAIA